MGFVRPVGRAGARRPAPDRGFADIELAGKFGDRSRAGLDMSSAAGRRRRVGVQF